MLENPFDPSFGGIPNTYIERKQFLPYMLNTANTGKGPWKSTIVSGVRGSGKTTLLTKVFRSLAINKNTIVVMSTMSPQLLDNIIHDLFISLSESDREIVNKDITSIGITGLSVDVKTDRKELVEVTQSFHSQFHTLIERINKSNKSVTILIDEVIVQDNESKDIMRTLASEYQLAINKGSRVSLYMAGLPNNVEKILLEKSSTFINRAKKVNLIDLKLEDVRSSYLNAFQKQIKNKNILAETVIKAADLTEGYAYLVQLIGYYLWENLTEFGMEDEEAFESALISSKEDLFQKVHNVIFGELAEKTKEFLIAMADDDEVSKVSDLQTKMNQTKGYINQYRTRLIKLGLIDNAGYGLLKYTLPFMKEYLNDYYESFDHWN